MFSLYARNNKQLELTSGQSLSITLSCPIFDPDRVARTFSLPFKIPLTPANRKAILHANRFDAHNSWDPTSARLFVGGGEFDNGEFVVLGSNDKEIDAVFRNAPTTLLDDLDKIKIYEILETVDIDQIIEAVATLTVHPPPFAYQIRVGSIDYTLGIGGSSSMTTGEVALYFANLINADYPGMAEATSTELKLDSFKIDEYPVFFSGLSGFTVASYISSGQASQANFLNHVETLFDTPADTHVFPVVRWRSFYEGKNKLYVEIVNPCFDGTALQNEPNEEETLFKYTYIPFIRLKYILNRIKEHVGIGYLAGYVDDPEFQRLILPNNYSCDRSYRSYYDTSDSYLYLNGFVPEIDLNAHVPRMSALDLIKKLAASLNLIIEYKDGGLYFSKVIDLLSLPPANWTKYVDNNGISLKLKQPKGLVLDYVENTKDAEPKSGQLGKYTLGAGGNNQYLPFNTFVEFGADLQDHGTFRCPRTNQPGRSFIFGGKENDLTFHLLFDRDTGTNTELEEYVYATHDEYASDHSTVVGELSLELTGDLGLVAQNFGDSLKIPDASDIDVAIVIPIGEIYRIRAWKNARITFYHPNGTVIAIIKSVEAQLVESSASMLVARASLSIIR